MFSIKKEFAELNRIRFILETIFEAGGGIFLRKLKLSYFVPIKCKLHCFFHPVKEEKCFIQMKGGETTLSPKILREVLEKLGPTFIKFGQVLSLRADLVGEDISKELSKLQDEVPVFAYEDAEKIIEKELGDKPEKIFKSFEKKPIASASLAQVYRATLKNGKEVAVKVQRPDIDKVILGDIRIFLYIAELVEKHIPESKPYQPIKVVKEFADWTMRELDFKVEGHNAERFRFCFKDNSGINIPEIYWDYTTSKVLTLEFMHGIKADDIKGMQKLKINRKKVAETGVDALLQQFLIDGFFHADPHPGNFFVLKGSRLCLHDFGMVGYLNENQRKELVSCFVAFLDKDSDSFLNHLMHLAITNDESDIEDFKKDVSEVLNDLFYSPRQPSIARVFFNSINLGAKRGVSFPADLVLFGKAIITSEAMGLKIYPAFNFNKQFEPFLSKVWKAYLSPKKLFKTLKNQFFDYQQAIKDLPLKVQEVFDKINKHEIGVKIDTSDLAGIKTEFDRQNDLRLIGMILTALLIAIIGIYYLEGKKIILGLPLNSILTGVFGILFIWFIYKLKKGPKQI
jgi:ubiquinone biosynthesis protein